MNQGLLDSELLEKDIAKIEFYKEEEGQLLETICNQLDSCLNSYNSQNSSILSTDLNNYRLKFKELASKRGEYTPVLRKAISQYEVLSKDTIRRFEGDL